MDSNETKQMKCPTFEQLIDYFDNRLPEAKAADFSAHLTDCASCVETRDWYQQLRLVTASDDTVEAPLWVLKRAVRIFEARPALSRLAKRFGDIIASLVFDSFEGRALAGVRSTETANRQFLYRAEDYSIDLQITQSEPARADLIGQVLRENDPTFESVSGLKLGVARGGKVLFSAVTDEMGEFKVSGVEHGVYDLRVELSNGSITIPDLPVSESNPA